MLQISHVPWTPLEHHFTYHRHIDESRAPGYFTRGCRQGTIGKRLWLTWRLAFVVAHLIQPFFSMMTTKCQAMEQLGLPVVFDLQSLNFLASRMCDSRFKRNSNLSTFDMDEEIACHPPQMNAGKPQENGTQKRLNLSLKKTKSNLMTLTRLKLCR